MKEEQKTAQKTDEEKVHAGYLLRTKTEKQEFNRDSDKERSLWKTKKPKSGGASSASAGEVMSRLLVGFEARMLDGRWESAYTGGYRTNDEEGRHKNTCGGCN